MHKAYKAALVALSALLLLCGCKMELREADMLTIVSGLGVDAGEGGGYELTIEVARPKSEGDGVEPVLVESRGGSLIEGMKDSTALTGRRLYFTHADILLLGRQTAENGVSALLDAVTSQNELPLTVRMMVSEGTSREVLGADSLMDAIRSRELRQTLTSNNMLSEAPDVSFYAFAGRVLETGVDGFLPYVRLIETEDGATQEVKGAALFRGGQMVCVIDKDLTQCLLWAAGETVSGVLAMDGNAFAVSNARAKISATTGGAVIELSVDISRSEGPLDEERTMQYARETIENRMQELISVTKRHGCDPLGLGREIKRRDLEGWRPLEQSWSESYSDFPIDFRLNVNYISSGRTNG